jgi:hypothetical protein
VALAFSRSCILAVDNPPSALENPLNMSSVYARLAPWLLELTELIMMTAAYGLILWNARKGPARNSRGFRSLQRKFATLARHKTLSAIAPGIIVLLGRLALVPILGIPQPRWHDEFSYLLAADTFAHGRVTNPTHPLWIHFESIHIIQQPTYMSMYPPGQGLILAAGQVLGHPWIGQLFITALLCSVLCWTLQVWLPPGWALFGGLMAALRIGLLSYWMNGYWSGALPALGGTLLLGTLPRIIKHGRPRDGLLMAMGAVILANSRPYEGLVFGIPFAIALLVWLFAQPKKNAARLAVVSSILAVTSMGAVATSYYYWRVTGSPFVLTYQVNRRTYATAPIFLWQTPPAEPAYRHPVMRDSYRWELAGFEENRTLRGALRKTWGKFVSSWQFYLGPLFTLPLLFLPWTIRERRVRFPLVVGLLLVAAISVETWTLPHYFSPGTSIVYIVVLQCMRHLWVWKRRRMVGAAMVRMLPLVACVMVVLRVVAAAADVQIEPKWPRGNLERAQIIRELRAIPGRDLVFVRYSSHHHADYEWVYNDADIDHSEIVWARDMGKQNQELLTYFPDRRAWVLDVLDYDAETKLSPY